MVKAEGATITDNPDVTQGRVSILNFPVNITDGALTLELSDTGGNDNHRIVNSMVLTKIGAEDKNSGRHLCLDT